MILQIFGRVGSIGVYVKRGEEFGYIKIILRGDIKEDQIIIIRKIDISNKLDWMLNGKSKIMVVRYDKI